MTRATKMRKLVPSAEALEKWIPPVFVAIGLGAAGLGFALPKARVAEWFHATGFYSIFASFVLWLTYLPFAKATRARAVELLREHWIAVSLAVATTAAAFLTSPPMFRILADETNLLGVAMDMYDEHSFRNPTEAIYYFGGVKQQLHFEWDKRPLLYPFLVYLAHGVFGYRPEMNGFLVNAVCSVGLYLSFYALLRRHTTKFYALVGTSLLFAFPVNVMWMTTSSFEIPNLFFGTLAFLAFDRMLTERSGAAAARVLAAVLLVSQVRYESALFAMVLLPAIALVVPYKEWPKIGYRALLVPPLFLAVVWQRRLATGQGIFQMQGDKPAFSLEWLEPNLKHAYNFFTAKQSWYGTIPVLFWSSLFGLLLVGIWFYRNRKTAGLRLWGTLIAASLIALAHAGILFVYYWGNLTLQYALRLGIIFLPFLVVLTLFALKQLLAGAEQHRHYVLAALFALYAYYWPEAGHNDAPKQIFIYREFNDVRGFLDREHPEKDYLLLSDLSNLYVPFRMSAISIGRANGDPIDVLRKLDRGLVQTVYAVQRVSFVDDQIQEQTKLDERLSLETVFETQHNGTQRLRISKVTAAEGVVIDPPPRPGAARRGGPGEILRRGGTP